MLDRFESAFSSHERLLFLLSIWQPCDDLCKKYGLSLAVGKSSNKIRFLGLDQGPKAWANELLVLTKEDKPIQYENLQEWDIRQNVKELEKMYDEAMRNV